MPSPPVLSMPPPHIRKHRHRMGFIEFAAGPEPEDEDENEAKPLPQFFSPRINRVPPETISPSPVRYRSSNVYERLYTDGVEALHRRVDHASPQAFFDPTAEPLSRSSTKVSVGAWRQASLERDRRSASPVTANRPFVPRVASLTTRYMEAVKVSREEQKQQQEHQESLRRSNSTMTRSQSRARSRRDGEDSGPGSTVDGGQSRRSPAADRWSRLAEPRHPVATKKEDPKKITQDTGRKSPLKRSTTDASKRETLVKRERSPAAVRRTPTRTRRESATDPSHREDKVPVPRLALAQALKKDECPQENKSAANKDTAQQPAVKRDTTPTRRGPTARPTAPKRAAAASNPPPKVQRGAALESSS